MSKNKDFETKLVSLIAIALKVPKKDVSIKLHMNQIKEWDSMGHLNILSEIEKYIGFELDLDIISEVQSVKDWLKILKKYKS